MIMRRGKTDDERALEILEDCRSRWWFAWRPVKLEKSGHWVWLEWVIRYRALHVSFTGRWENRSLHEQCLPAPVTVGRWEYIRAGDMKPSRLDWWPYEWGGRKKL